MKAKVIRSDIQISPAFAHCVDSWAEQIEWREVLENGSMEKRPFWKAGTVLDSATMGPALADCWRAVQCGWAEPADDECDAKSGRMSQERLQAAQHAYERLTRGIHPDDFAAYDAGEMTGYNPDGTWVHGPNWKEPEEEAEDDQEDE